MRVLVAFAGDTEKTSTVLHEKHGVHLKPETLLKWRDEQFPDEYQDLAAEHAHRLEDLIVAETREAVVVAGKLQREALEKAASLLGTATDAKTAAQIANDVSKVKAANTRDLLTLTGRPARITEDRDARTLFESIVKKGLYVPVRRDAIEVKVEDVAETD